MALIKDTGKETWKIIRGEYPEFNLALDLAFIAWVMLVPGILWIDVILVIFAGFLAGWNAFAIWKKYKR